MPDGEIKAEAKAKRFAPKALGGGCAVAGYGCG